MRFLASILLMWIAASAVQAHPVAKSSHDRHIVVRLLPGLAPDKVLIRVEYRLEVDELTVHLEDMRPFQDEIDTAKYAHKPLEYYGEFTRIYAPILASRLDLRIDTASFDFACANRTQTLKDETRKDLGHLRCDFVFEAEAQLQLGQEHLLKFREGNYLLQAGIIDVTFACADTFKVLSIQAPDADLRAKPEIQRAPGDDKTLRELRVRFALEKSVETTADPLASDKDSHESGLMRLFHSANDGYWLLPILAFWFGAVHALTPGHGKTLVAAYLVGQSGTTWHAVVLGIVTTFTHTSVVFALAMVLMVLPAGVRPTIQSGLELVMGLLILCLGFYLLLQRLSGRADHIHIGGGHHHHHGDQHAHGHDHHHHHPSPSPAAKVTTWGLVTLGITGGLVPCWDAVAMLVLAVALNMLDLAIPLLLAFSAGLAGMLVLIGILVVKVRRFADSRVGEGRLIRALPIVSALFIQGMGFWLCYNAVHPLAG